MSSLEGEHEQVCGSLSSGADVRTLARAQGGYEKTDICLCLQEEVYEMWELSPVFSWGSYAQETIIYPAVKHLAQA